MMLDQLVIHETREAFDPHWDMRLDIDDMSYEVGKTDLASYCLLAAAASNCSSNKCVFLCWCTGAPGFGRKNRQCQHWPGGRENLGRRDGASLPQLLCQYT